MTRLRITEDGTIRGLWSDAVDLTSLGTLLVGRASHVEFDAARQCWTVVPAHTRSMVFSSRSRSEALAWEAEHFQPGGRFWPQSFKQERRE